MKSPGPQQYHIPCTISNMPQYTGARPEKFAYIWGGSAYPGDPWEKKENQQHTNKQLGNLQRLSVSAAKQVFILN